MCDGSSHEVHMSHDRLGVRVPEPTWCLPASHITVVAAWIQ